MGPPPDPEQMISMLENPQFASSMNEALQNPQIIEHLIQSHPMLRNMEPQVRQAMQDPNFRRMMTDPALIRQVSRMSREFGGVGGFGGPGGGQAGGEGAFPAPGVTDTTPRQESERNANPSDRPVPPVNPFALLGNLGGNSTNAAGGMAVNPFAALFQPPANPTASTTSQSQGTPTSGTPASGNTPGTTNTQQNPLTNLAQNPLFQNPALMQQMLGLMGGGQGGAEPGGSPPASGGGFNPFAMFGAPQPEPPRDTRPPEERYEEQLRQLNDMGFYEFDRNVEALRRTGGSVQGAVEYLLTH